MEPDAADDDEGTAADDDDEAAAVRARERVADDGEECPEERSSLRRDDPLCFVRLRVKTALVWGRCESTSRDGRFYRLFGE